MKLIRKQNLLGHFIYAPVWIILYLSPILLEYFEMPADEDATMNWSIILDDWKGITYFFIIFLINNFILSPLLLFRKRYILYTVSVLCLVGGLLMIYLFKGPTLKKSPVRTEMAPPFATGPVPGTPPVEFKPGEGAEMGYQPEEFRETKRTAGCRYNGKKRYNRAPEKNFCFPGFIIFMFIRFLIAILMIGFNVAIKLLFKSIRDEETLKELERHNLQSELEYLKYQINPHFFMNALNNIYALVDIDTEQAKKTIVELSKMMRYVLYEANHKTILLSREITFLKNYIELMRIRYPDKVSIQVSVPESVPEVQIPPLLFISFIENAFKHRVTYQAESYIRISLKYKEGKVIFTCANSNYGKSEDQHKGIGLENVRKRLKLLYGEDYIFTMDENSDSFNVFLLIPVL
ncbi:MAG: histidine kinase [Bacteroides sp.]|nr:histidine kinase [Bacteroides sp.]